MVCFIRPVAFRLVDFYFHVHAVKIHHRDNAMPNVKRIPHHLWCGYSFSLTRTLMFVSTSSTQRTGQGFLRRSH